MNTKPLIRKWKRIYMRQSATISVCAMVGCIIAAAVGSPRSCCFDYLGLIIGILALMVTVVVAWNIWQVIDTKNTVKKAEEASKRIDELQRLVESTKSSYQSYVFYVDALRDFDKGQYSTAFTNIASSFEAAIEYEVSFSRFGRRALDLMDKCINKGQESFSSFPDIHIETVERLLRQVSKNRDYFDLATSRLQNIKSRLEAMRK